MVTSILALLTLSSLTFLVITPDAHFTADELADMGVGL